MADRKILQHWPVLVIVLAVAGVFGFSLITFQVENSEYAVVKRFGKPLRVVTPGLHFKWPYPMEAVWKADSRIQCFEGKTGVAEEVFTRDERNIILTTYLCWRIDRERQIQFLEQVGTLAQAEDDLTALLRSHRNAVAGTYSFGDLINIDAEKVKIGQLETDLLSKIKADASTLYGIEVTAVGVKHIGFPESVTTKVFERMKAERAAIAQDILSQGEAESIRIRAEADKDREQTLADAENAAKKLRGEGDAEAARHYARFEASPDLASFLRRLDALEKIMSDRKTTLVLDERTPPFDLLREDVLEGIKLKGERPAPGRDSER